MMTRFKIDFNDSLWAPFVLYHAERGWWGVNWKSIRSFETQEKARAYYETIKGLPEYLP